MDDKALIFGKMKYLALLCLFLQSCSLFSKRERDLFQGIALDNNSDWLLSHCDNYGNCKIINNLQILRENYKQLEIDVSKRCEGTTPDYCFELYKDGDRLNIACYCAEEKGSVKLGTLENKFLNAKRKAKIAKTIKEHNKILDSLKSRSNIYLIYERDTNIKFPGVLSFSIKLENNEQDIFTQEKPIELAFRRLFPDSNYTMKAKWYLSDPNTNTLGYKIIIDCDSDFTNKFEDNKLNQNPIFNNRTEPIYKNKEFFIPYFEW